MKYNLYLKLESSESNEVLPPVRLYSGDTLRQALYLGLKLFRILGRPTDCAGWVKAFNKEREL